MLKHLGRFVGAGLLAIALLAAPQARATDLSLDGNLRLQCDVATASAGAATLNNKCGTITSESLSTAAGSIYTLTLTNSAIATGDLMFVSTTKGTSTGGAPVVHSVNAAAGSAVVLIMNNPTGTGTAAGGTAFNGTITVKYLMVKP